MMRKKSGEHFPSKRNSKKHLNFSDFIPSSATAKTDDLKKFSYKHRNIYKLQTYTNSIPQNKTKNI